VSLAVPDPGPLSAVEAEIRVIPVICAAVGAVILLVAVAAGIYRHHKSEQVLYTADIYNIIMSACRYIGLALLNILIYYVCVCVEIEIVCLLTDLIESYKPILYFIVILQWVKEFI